jgi:hypothetical protein
LSFASNIGGEELGQETSMTKVGIAAFIGAMVEWYDYFLYGLAASVVFTQLFFPLENRLFGTLAAFATFVLVSSSAPWGAPSSGTTATSWGGRPYSSSPSSSWVSPPS